MVQSKAGSVEEYIAELPPERAAVIEEVRELVLDNLPEGVEETMNFGMISYEIPLERYPETYNGQPLMYVALAAQKHHYALYLHSVYADQDVADALGEAYREADVELDEPTAFSRRDAAIVPLIVGGARKIKRVLADEQNGVLDTLRRNEPVTQLDDLLPELDAHLAIYVTALADDLVGSAAGGAVTCTCFRRNTWRRPRESSAPRCRPQPDSPSPTAGCARAPSRLPSPVPVP